MQTASEIKSAVSNIRFYVDKLRELNSKQFDLDTASNTLMGKRISEKELLESKLVRLTGQIGASCSLILLGCQNIEKEVGIAEE